MSNKRFSKKQPREAFVVALKYVSHDNKQVLSETQHGISSKRSQVHVFGLLNQERVNTASCKKWKAANALRNSVFKSHRFQE